MVLTPRRIRSESSALAAQLRVRVLIAGAISRAIPTMALPTVRAKLYRWAGFQIGPQVAFLGPMRTVGGPADAPRNLSVGRGSVIGIDALFNLDAPIRIGERVSLGPAVKIFTSSHMLGPGSRRMDPAVMRKPVVIGDGAWVAVGATILPGVAIGPGAVISAGAIVAQDVPANSLVPSPALPPSEPLPWGDS